MLKDIGDWLKECLNSLFFNSSEIQKRKQTLQTPLSTAGQKASLSTKMVEAVGDGSSSTSLTSQVSQTLISESYHKAYLEYLMEYLVDLTEVYVKDSLKIMLKDVFIEPQLSLALPYIDQFSLPNISAACISSMSANIWERLALHHAYVILGAAGSGKTSLLLHITHSLMDYHLKNEFPNKSQPGSHNWKKLPILLFLRHHSQSISNKPDYSLLEAIQETLAANGSSTSLPSRWFEERLIEGKCLVMLDGLNEVPKDERLNVLRWIEHQIEGYNKNIFLISSRTVGYEHLLPAACVLAIEPFSLEQIQNFVKRWYLVQESDLEEETSKLFHLYREPNLSHLLKNPLTLTMMTNLFWAKRSLPARQVDLYAAYIEFLLQSSDLTHQFNLSPEKKRRVLQVLAYQMMKLNLVEISEDEAVRLIYVPLDMVSRQPDGTKFLQAVAKESRLLRQSQGKYRFSTLFLQEYLATLHLDERPESEIITRVDSSWWHETSRLYAIHTNGSKILAAALNILINQQQKKSCTHLPALQLAISCAQQISDIKPELLHQLQRILELQVDTENPLERWMIAEALLDWRLMHMMRVNQNLYVADSLITNAEYKLFLEEQRIANSEADHKFNKAFLIGSGQKAVTDVQPKDAVAFCEWLTKRDKLAFRYRLPYSGEFSPLVSKISYWTQKEDQQAYELEEQPHRELSLGILERRLRSLIARDIADAPDAVLERLTTFDEALERAFTKKDNRTLALGLVRDFVHDRAHWRVINQQQETSHSAHSDWYAHFIAWQVIHKLLTLLAEEPKPRSWLEQFDRHRMIIPSLEQKVLADEYFELYNDLAALEEGVLGRLLTHRGIRIVGERHFSSATHKRTVLQKKICLLGDEAVGKTSLVQRFVEGRFDEKYLSTMGVSISRKTIEQPTYTMNMVIWDMEGAQGFQKMQLNYLRGAAGALIVCDLTRRQTLATFERYARQLHSLNPAMPIVFIGNKIDLPLRQITGQELEEISTRLGGSYLLTSAKTGTQVEEAFCLLADLIEKA